MLHDVLCNLCMGINMKKIILFIIIILVFIIAILYTTYAKGFFAILDEKKVYKIENIIWADSKNCLGGVKIVHIEATIQHIRRNRRGVRKLL